MGTTDTNTKTRELVKVTTAKDFMTASAFVRKPGPGESDVTKGEISDAIESAGVVFGIMDDAIEEIVEGKQYNSPIKVAEGVKPTRGKSATFEFKFDTSAKHIPAEDEDGRIDYHDISFIQNTMEDDLLAIKTLPTEGTIGKTVLGKEIVGPPGKDLFFKNGANTRVSSDGLELRSAANGAIVHLNGRTSVSDIMIINSDVDFNVGNIDCRGSVKISGAVKAGFELTVDGDIEIGGNVEDATIKCKGNIMVKGGFFGNGKGVMHADGDVTIKYAEGQKISSGGSIYVGGELVNCQVTAKDQVQIKGRRGKIVGGDTRAGKLIRTSVAGSDAGTPTNLHVAYDDKLIKKHREVENEKTRLGDDSARVKEALYALYKLQMDGKLPKAKEEVLAKLEEFQKDLPDNLENLESQKLQIEAKLKEYADSCIICEETLHAGVSAHFGIIYREILEDKESPCKISLEGTIVMISEFRKEK